MPEGLPAWPQGQAEGTSVSNSLTPQERTLRAKLAAHTRWSGSEDRTDATAPARKEWMDRFERQVDPEGTLPPDVRAKRAASARKAYYTALAYKSVTARRKARGYNAGEVA